MTGQTPNSGRIGPNSGRIRRWLRNGAASLAIATAATAGGMMAFAPVSSADVAGAGSLIAGAGISSVYGATANVGLKFSDLFGVGIDALLDFRAGEEGQGLQLEISRKQQLGQTFLGSDTVLDYGVSATDEDWDFRSYRNQNYEVKLGVGAHLTEQFSYRVGLFHQFDKLESSDSTLSPLVLADMKESTASGIDISLDWSNRESDSVLQPGLDLGLGYRASGLGDSREFQAVTAGIDYYHQVFGAAVVNFGLAGGVVTGGGDGYVAINDRAFLGGDMPRGFAYGGIGPVDASTGDSLGGTRYVSATAQVIVPTARPGLAIGAFWDGASLSDLPGIDSADVDESGFLRQSVGISVYYDTKMGQFSAALAAPIEKRPEDEVQNLSFSFTANF